MKLFTLDNSLILGTVGSLAEADKQAVREALEQLFPL